MAVAAAGGAAMEPPARSPILVRLHGLDSKQYEGHVAEVVGKKRNEIYVQYPLHERCKRSTRRWYVLTVRALAARRRDGGGLGVGPGGRAGFGKGNWCVWTRHGADGKARQGD